ncbi:MAG: leucyl aminopeptidase [Actinobacteria bacterium]|nr:leucyl aminopeptidase [Actinomycetota bacterium]
MLTIAAGADDARRVAADLLVLPVFKGGIEGPGTAAVLHAVGLDDLPVTPGFRGDIGQTLLLGAGDLPASGVLLVGLGRMDAADPRRLREAAAVAAGAARGASGVATTLAQVHPTDAAVQAVTEGFCLGSHSDRRWKTPGRQPGADDEPTRLRHVELLVPSSRLAQARASIERGGHYAAATCAARDLVNLPPDRKRPAALADAVEGLVGGAAEVTVSDESVLDAEGFGGLLAVGRGSASPPRLVELRYRPEAALGHVVLLGKGITFDSGGLSLKRGDDMRAMKADMAGAAAVAAVFGVLADLDVHLEVTGLLPLAENMPGADAQRPGDVVRCRGGTTVEVVDTDAEGRLVLADTLRFAAGWAPDAMVDLATLTGSAVAAVGHYAAAVMGTDEELVRSLRQAADVAGERLWPLPLWPEFEDHQRSPVADLRNVGEEEAGGGAIAGGVFLRHFAGDVPWAHLDIAGPAFLPERLASPTLPAGGTGFGVRTLLAWLERRAE